MKTGTVLSVNAESRTVVVDIGAKDVSGSPVYLADVPFGSMKSPEPGEVVTLVVQRDVQL